MRRTGVCMHVSAELFKAMIERMSQGSSDQHERRSSPRVNINAKVAIVSDFANLEKPVDIEVRDLSLSGVGFEHDAALRKGSTFVLLLPASDDTCLSVLCVVRHCRGAAAGNRFVVGAEFRQVLGIPPKYVAGDAEAA